MTMQASTSQPLTTGARTALANVNGGAASQVVQKSQPSNLYQLKKLRAVHHQILRMSAQMMDGSDIAKTLGCSKEMVYYTINSELGKQKLEVLAGQADISSINVLEEFSALAPVALETVEEIMVDIGARDSDRLTAADKILSGAGLLKQQTVNLNMQLMSDDNIREAKLKARKMGKFLGVPEEEIVDAEVIEESTGEND